MQRAVNPQTGEVLFLVNNQWVPPSQTARNPQTGQFAYLVNNEWQIQDPFKKEEEQPGFFDRLVEAAQTSREPEDVKTRNPLMGFVARASGLAGAALEVPDTLAQLMSNLTGLPKDQVFELPIDTVGKKFADKALNYEKDIGYAPSTELKDLADNPLNAIPFIAERVVTSIPDMAAAYAAAPAYFAARTNEILKSRVENDNKTLAEATVGDVSAAAGAAAFETVFEKFATGRLLPGGGAAGKTPIGRIAKETGVQAGTEFAEELGTYTAETAGTERGFKPEEAVLAGIEGAIVGGGIGSGAQTTRESIDAYQRARAGAPTPTPAATPGTTPAVTPAATPAAAPPAVTGQSPVTPISPSGNVLGGYNNAPDNTQTLITRTPDNRFQVTTVDTATGQSMDSGIFDTVEEADAVAGQIVGFTPPAPPAPTAVTPPTPTGVAPTTPPITPVLPTVTPIGAAPQVPVTPALVAPEAAAPVTPTVEVAPTVTAVPETEPPVITPTGTPPTVTPTEAVSVRDRRTVQTELNRVRQSLRQMETAFKKKQVPESEVTRLQNMVNALEQELEQARPTRRVPVFRSKEGNTWTGAGNTPAWLRKKLDQGMDLEDFRIRSEFNNKSQDELEETEIPYGFGRTMPETRPPKELEDLIAQSEQARKESPNLFNVLRGKITPEDVNDITPEANLNFLKAPRGRGRDLSDIVNDGTLDDFLDIPHNAENFDLTEATEYIKDLLRQDFKEDPTLMMSVDTKNQLRSIELKISELEAELEPEDVNRELQAVYAEERAIAQEAEAAALEEQERGAAIPTGPPTAIREPTPEERRQADLGKTLSESQFYRQYMQHIDIRGRREGTAEQTRDKILQDGFKTGIGVNAFTPYRGGEPQTVVERRLMPKKNDIVYLAPKGAWVDTPNGAVIQDGWKPKPWEVIKVSEDGPSMYQEYLKARQEYAGTLVREDVTPEERRRAELERDFFSLTPPTPPERTTPPGAQRDLFGVEGLERATPEKVNKRKAENAQQLSLFVDSKLPPNEDNQAGKAARREAVSTVDALQSTDTPLALALSTDYARRQRVSLVGQKLTGYDDLAVLSQVYRHPRFETFRLFFVNDANEVVSQLGVTSRLPAAVIAVVGDSNIEYMKKVQDAAVQAGATGVWMLHNHPSGNVEVSNADKSVTKTFTNAFTKLAYKGHIVIDTNKYSVITPEGYVQTYSKEMGQKKLLQKDLRTYGEAFSPIEMAKKVDEDPQSMVVIAVDSSLDVTGITTIGNEFLKGKTQDQVRRALYKLAISQSGSRLAVASRDKDALDKVAGMVEDGIWIQPDGQYKYFSSMYSYRTKYLFPDERPGVVTPDTSKLFDFLRIPKEPRPGRAGSYRWADARRLMEEPMTIKVQEPQSELFGEDAKTLKTLDEDLPKAKKKLPPGRSPELAAMAELLKEGSVTKEEYDAAVNRFRPIPVYTEPLTPATDEQVVNALSSDKKPKANVSIPDGTKVGLRLDIPAWNNHKTFVVSIHEGRPKVTSPSPGKAIGYRSVAMAKNVTFGLGNQAKALEIATGAAKDALQTMEGEYVNVSPSEALEMAKKAIKDPRYVQLGFDPTRHAYFYDRRTTLPVVKADAVLQIGNMILARGVEYGSKQNFLYNIDTFQSSLFGEPESDALKKAEQPESDIKTVKRGRSPELTEAAEKLRRGEITKKEYEEAVQKYSPITLYAEPPKPATDSQVVEALDSNKRKDANVEIKSRTKVGLRLDIPAWERGKTWVVAIHKGKPKVTSPKASEILSYRSVAGLKNVTFGVGDQAKTLNIAAGAFKDKLQTMEGEYVSLSPEEAYKRAQELIKDPAYVQIGFNPTRHAYFYDRNTMAPVVKADEVLQIGNFILAKGVKYGAKEDFLFNIDLYPQITEDEANLIPVLSREEKIAEYAALRARRERLVRGVIEGGATVDLQRSLTQIDEMSKALKSEIEAEYVPNMSPENFLRRALEAFDNGDLSVDVLATIQATYNKTPWLLNGLRLSVRTPKKPGRSSGNFNPIDRIVTLWNGTSGVENPSSVRHEIMHSLEQMMTADQRKAVIDSWQDALKKAVKANPDQPSQEYFSKVMAFLDAPSEASFAAAVQAMPSYDFYQYLNPSEYWAINAEKLMEAKLGGGWDRFVKAVKKLFEGLKSVFGFNNTYGVHKVFDQIMRDKPNPMGTESLTDFVAESGARPVPLENIATNIFGQPIPKGTWGSPNDSKMDNVIYVLQDKHIDTKRVVENIKAAGKNIADRWNPYLQEELFHGRTAKQTQDFLKNELEPLMIDIRNRGLTMDQVEEYLHNRHAESRNKFNAKRDPKMPDGGSGILTADAQKYLAALTPQQKKDFDAIAKRIDYMVAATQQILVDTGQETQQTIDAWNKALPDYVPLQREEVDYDVKNVGIGVGSGIAVKGPFSRAAVGSSKQVVDILANLAMQRERAIVRGEKMRVSKALYGLVASNPNPTFWLAFDPEAIKDPLKAAAELASLGLNPADIQNIIDEPVVRRVDPVTNQVVERPNALLVNSRTSIPVRINGKEKYVIFNAKDPRAERMAEALKNLDADQLGKVMGGIQQFTQYFAKINTQYNPIFGVINFLRDVQGAMIQVSNTPLSGDRLKILGGTPGALRGIYAEERARRAGKPPVANSWAQLWEEFQQEGGQTGFRDQFSRSQERADALQAILDPSSWTKSPLGKVFTAGGTLKVPMEIARKTAAPLFDWLSDYNQSMENAIRLSAYKTALDKGMTKQQAASLAKNLTVNFNRKGQIGRQAGALYAFFNAAVQGTARMANTMFQFNGKRYELSSIGKKIFWGGIILGSAQAAMLAALGFDEDEPPEFVKERNFIIPRGDGKYFTIPMPLGYNVIPNTSRILTEWMLSGFKDTPKRVASLTGSFLDMFNPLGNAGWSFQTFAPTVADPIVALGENRDWTGKPIAKKDISSLDPTPGYTRAKETASALSKEIAYYLNATTGGTNYAPGVISPTPDQIDYLIGQLTGGVGRELLKAEQTVTSQFTGEELPIYKVPLVGRFMGETTGVAAERNRFYSNLIELNRHEREIKGRIKDKIPTRDYLLEYPEARLYNYANQVERNIRTLRQRRDMLIEKGAPKEQVKAVENQMMVQMKRFNDRVKEAQQ